MKRFHVHLKVKNLQESIDFYTALFNEAPTVSKLDYAKWMLENPRINFAISQSEKNHGIEHLGLQVDNTEELEAVYDNMKAAKGKILEEGKTTCCYAKSQKSWITDPQGVDWEAFYTFDNATVYGEGKHTKPAPEVMENWNKNEQKPKPI